MDPEDPDSQAVLARALAALAGRADHTHNVNGSYEESRPAIHRRPAAILCYHILLGVHVSVEPHITVGGNIGYLQPLACCNLANEGELRLRCVH